MMMGPQSKKKKKMLGGDANQLRTSAQAHCDERRVAVVRACARTSEGLAGVVKPTRLSARHRRARAHARVEGSGEGGGGGVPPPAPKLARVVL